MKYSLYAELLEGNLENIDFNEKDFCDKLQAALQLNPGRKGFTSNMVFTGMYKTIKTEEGQAELWFRREKSEDKSEITVSNHAVAISYKHYKREQKEETTISGKKFEFEHGVYMIDGNKVIYYDSDAIEFTKEKSKTPDSKTPEFNTINAASYGIVPDKEAEIEDPIDFFTSMVTLSKDGIDAYLQKFVSQSHYKHS